MRLYEFIDETAIKLSGSSDKAKAWIKKVYDLYPQTWQNNHVMPLGGQGDDQQFAMFELEPSFSKRGAVEIKWFQAYPLRQGVGSRAMKELQRMAQEDGIALTLYPWDKGQVSQSKLTKFYKGHGFNPTVKGAKNMAWNPVEEAANAAQQAAIAINMKKHHKKPKNEDIDENFDDGKNPGRKGLSQRVGIPKNATIAQLEKHAKASGEEGRMARWQLNMRRGRNK
jgi:hypothetical protein